MYLYCYQTDSPVEHADVTVRELSRASLLLDLQRQKVPLARDTKDNFLGFRRKANGKLALESGQTGWTSMTCVIGLKWSSGGHGLICKLSQ